MYLRKGGYVMAVLKKFADSARELRPGNTVAISKRARIQPAVVVTGVLIGLDLILKMLSVSLTSSVKITFAYLALASIGMLFGPTVGFLAGVLTDIIGYLFRPEGGFNILFTLVEAVGAMIYGLFLYGIKPLSPDVGKERENLKKTLPVILSKVTVVIVCNLILTPMAMVLSGYMTFDSMLAAYPVRLIKNLIQCPVDCIIMIAVLFPVLKAYRRVWSRDENVPSVK